MNDLWKVSTVRLTALRAALGRMSDPLTLSKLQAAGFADEAICLAPLLPLSVVGAAAVVDALLAERANRAAPRLTLVWTGPDAVGTTARSTAAVVRELLSSAERYVVVAGFAFYNAREIFAPLRARMLSHGVETEFFVHIPPGAGIGAFWQHTWPWSDATPVVWASPPGSAGVMHAKCLIVDGRRALVTSANFTDAALSSNVEAGVLIEDASFADELVAQWRGLAGKGLFARLG